MIESNKLMAYSEFPMKKDWKANNCFVINRKLTSAMDKIIIYMQGSKFREEHLRRLSEIGQF